MKYLLDTVVVSERSKAVPHAPVITWLEQQSRDSVFISAVTLGELRYGVEKLEAGARRRRLNDYVIEVERSFTGKVLAIAAKEASLWAVIRRRAERRRLTIPTADAMLAATAEVHGLTLVTRNTKDFEGWDGPVLNPWEPQRSTA